MCCAYNNDTFFTCIPCQFLLRIFDYVFWKIVSNLIDTLFNLKKKNYGKNILIGHEITRREMNLVKKKLFAQCIFYRKCFGSEKRRIHAVYFNKEFNVHLSRYEM